MNKELLVQASIAAQPFQVGCKHCIFHALLIMLEYGGILYSHEKENILKKIQSFEVQAIKIAFRLPHGLQIHGAMNWSPLIKSLKD